MKSFSFLSSAIVISEQANVDKASGLYTITSVLEYKPTKEDTNAQFTCTVSYFGPTGLETIRSESVAFDIHCKFINIYLYNIKSVSAFKVVLKLKFVKCRT